MDPPDNSFHNKDIAQLPVPSNEPSVHGGLPGRRPVLKFPVAGGAEIIRANQKDSYFQSILLDHVQSVFRTWKGSRFVHTHSISISSFSALLYLLVTTAVGSRTLGEEYCDMFYILEGGGTNKKQAAAAAATTTATTTTKPVTVPSLNRRLAFVVAETLGPLALLKLVPILKSWTDKKLARAKMQETMEIQRARVALQYQPPSASRESKNKKKTKKSSAPTPIPTARKATVLRVRFYSLLSKLFALTPGLSKFFRYLLTLHLALFYFQGKYYSVLKRMFGLRYLFGHKDEGDNKSLTSNGYEILGALLAVQTLTQLGSDIVSQPKVSAALGQLSEKVKSAVWKSNKSKNTNSTTTHRRTLKSKSKTAHKVDDDVDESSSEDEDEKAQDQEEEPQDTKVVIKPDMTPQELVAAVTLGGSQSDSQSAITLDDPSVMAYIPDQSRSCVLCLSPLTDPTTTLCGHIFCWTCVSEWCREKPECPLCRQANLEQNLLPLK